MTGRPRERHACHGNVDDAPARLSLSSRARALCLGGTLVLATVGACGSSGSGDDRAVRVLAPRTTFGLESLTSKQRDFTVSTVAIDAPGQEVEVLGLRPVMTPNVEYLGAVTVWPRNFDSYSDGGPGFPTKGIKTHHPALGTVIPAAETAFRRPGYDTTDVVYVNAGFRLVSGTAGVVNDVEVTYRAGSKVRTERSATAVVACLKPCDQRREYEQGRDFRLAVLEQFGMKQED